MVDDRSKEIIELYVNEARRLRSPIQDFAWNEYQEKDRSVQRDVCKYVFTTYEDVKVENLGWGFRIKFQYE